MMETPERRALSNLECIFRKDSLGYMHPLRALIFLSGRFGKCYGFKTDKWEVYLNEKGYLYSFNVREPPSLFVSIFCVFASFFQFLVWKIRTLAFAK